MKNSKLLLLTVPLLLVCCISACKKKGLNPATIRIATVDYTEGGGTTHYRVVYDAYENVDSIVSTGIAGTAVGDRGYLGFSYIGSSYTVANANGSLFEVYANTNGQVLKLLIADTTTFAYNGTELGEIDYFQVTNTYPFYIKSETQYTWENGNLLTVSQGSDVQTYDYDNSKSAQAGDAIRIDEFLALGRSYIKTNNLPVDMLQGGVWAEKYLYQYDGQGRISQLQKVRNNVSYTDTVVYKYAYY